MKIALVFLSTICTLFLACNTKHDEPQKVLQPEQQVQPKNTETVEQVEAKIPKKYVYVKIKYTTDVDGVVKTFVKSSDITEVDWLDGNKMARLEDEYIESLSFWKEVKILDRKCELFHSYYEASENRFKTQNEF